MKRLSMLAACVLVLPAAAFAATKTYDLAAFEEVSVSAGISADIRVGSPQGVVAETRAKDFDDLQVRVEGKVLRIGRPSRFWNWGFSRRPRYQVHIVTPALRSIGASSGADVTVAPGMTGDFSLSASSGADIEVSSFKGGHVKASVSSGSDASIDGTCLAIDASASSGADLDAGKLVCETAAVHASSGSDISIAATKRVTGAVSSGAGIGIAGSPPVVEVNKSSGGDVRVRSRTP